jgi:ABC-2 type transport system ATP-binding protein
MEGLLASYRLIKGRPQDLTAELEKSIIGLRKTDIGFEGLIETNEAAKYKDCVIDAATIDNIIISMTKRGEGK